MTDANQTAAEAPELELMPVSKAEKAAALVGLLVLGVLALICFDLATGGRFISSRLPASVSAAAGPAADEPCEGCELTISADLGARLEAALADIKGMAARPRPRPSSLVWLEPTAYSLASLPVVRSADGGPNTGFWWAIQRITVGPFGAATDTVTIYKGNASAWVQPQNALNSLFTAQVGAFVTWHPGGKGEILMPDEMLVLGGTITGANPMMNWEVIQGEMWELAEYVS